MMKYAAVLEPHLRARLAGWFRATAAVSTALLAAGFAGPPASAGEITFHDVAAGDGAGFSYRRAPSVTNAAYERIKRQPYYTMPSIVATPEKPRGAPGVALLDHDGDGDLDVYVTNGPGAANSLYANRLRETGELRFEDVGEAAGVAATAQDSTGVCYGDLDNDGDPDLLVLGRSEPNRLFENRGDGTFRDVTAASGLGEDDLGHTSCAVGDVDGDGLLDVAVANSYDWRQRAAIISEPWSLNHPNQLYLAEGGLRFRDVSESSGIRKLTGLRGAPPGAQTMTWALALVDYDQDGDLDLIHADDQGAIPPHEVSRGLIQVFRNDGTGHFTPVTHEAGTAMPGSSWMGLSFADFDCDGEMDFFATNMGDYAFSAIGFPFQRGEMSSRWFLGRPDGTFVDAGTGALRATGFGWSVMTPDYDNDGDPDVAYYGSLDATINTITADNPGSLLANRGCTARFESDLDALADTDHGRRNVHGGATGDLDGDGFPDLVTASAFDIPEEVPLKPYPVDHDSPYDPQARYVEVFSPAGAGTFVWNGYEFPDGTLAVEMNSGNGNGWIEVRTLGTVDLLPDGRVNRDGIGAVVRTTPRGGKTTLRPVTGGSSYASQNSLSLLFGLGDAPDATVEVLWPGGVRNRLYGVSKGERVVFPEIPCDLDGAWAGRQEYRTCVTGALDRLTRSGHLTEDGARRFLESALRAFGTVPGPARRVAAEAPPGENAAVRGGGRTPDSEDWPGLARVSHERP